MTDDSSDRRDRILEICDQIVNGQLQEYSEDGLKIISGADPTCLWFCLYDQPRVTVLEAVQCSMVYKTYEDVAPPNMLDDFMYWLEVYDFWRRYWDQVIDAIGQCPDYLSLFEVFKKVPDFRAREIVKRNPTEIIPYLKACKEAMVTASYKLSKQSKSILCHVYEESFGGLAKTRWCSTRVIEVQTTRDSFARSLKRLETRRLLFRISPTGEGFHRRTTFVRLTHLGFMIGSCFPRKPYTKEEFSQSFKNLCANLG